MATFFVPKADRGEIRRSLGLVCQVMHRRRVIGETSLDLSAAGMLLRSDEDIDVGESVQVRFCATDLGLWFDTDARIARIVQGRRPGDRGRALGLKFESLGAVSRLILRGQLRRIPPTLPRRKARVDYAMTIAEIDRGRI